MMNTAASQFFVSVRLSACFLSPTFLRVKRDISENNNKQQSSCGLFKDKHAERLSLLHFSSLYSLLKKSCLSFLT